MKRLPALSGHGDHESRLSIIPVPTLDFNDRMVRRVIIAAPDSTSARNATAKLGGLHLASEEGMDKGYLVPADSNAVFSDYLAASKRWTTVTPILGAFDNGDVKQRLRNFARMFEQAGLPAPARVTFMPCKSRCFVGKHHGHLPRFFAEVEFVEPVSGVVAAGAGRYTGLGIFANLSRSAAG